MCERLKLVRANFKMNQADFAKSLGIGQSTLAMMEVGKREISDRHIKAICAIFDINEEWLRSGIGEMFVEDDNFLLSSLSQQYGLDNLDRKIIETYIKLSDNQRNTIKSFVHNLVDNIMSDDNYEEYRAGYIKEKAAPIAARHGSIDGMAEAVNMYDDSKKGLHKE